MAHSHALEFDGGAEVERPSHFAELSPSYQARRGSLDHFAEQVRELGTANSPEQMLRLGELVYGVMKSTESGKSAREQRASLRRIASHPDVPFKVTTIWRAVSVYEMSLRLPHLLGVKGLGISHLRAVIGLDPVDQELLLGRASTERWTKRQLEREAAKRRDGRRRGRRPLPQITAWTRELQRALEHASELDGAEEEVSDSARAELLVTLRDLEGQIQSLYQRLSGPAEDEDQVGLSG